MSKLTVITERALERALELAGTAGDQLRHAASNAGDQARHAGSSLRHFGPSASEWLKTGAALGAVRTGGKAASKLVKRNPAVTVAAAVAGLGLIGYAVYRKRQRDQQVLGGNVHRLDRE
ncbi:membrane protein, partial [Xanthomonas euvesicatoria]